VLCCALLCQGLCVSLAEECNPARGGALTAAEAATATGSSCVWALRACFWPRVHTSELDNMSCCNTHSFLLPGTEASCHTRASNGFMCGGFICSDCSWRLSAGADPAHTAVPGARVVRVFETKFKPGFIVSMVCKRHRAKS
jgi:hypothetical protein